MILILLKCIFKKIKECHICNIFNLTSAAETALKASDFYVSDEAKSSTYVLLRWLNLQDTGCDQGPSWHRVPETCR